MNKFEVSMEGNELVPVNNELPFEESDIENSEEMRVYKAKELGLNENAPWDEIVEIEDARNIARRAKALGLPENASHDEVLAEENRRGYAGRSYGVTLGVGYTATLDEMDKAEAEQRQKKLIVLHKVAEEMLFNQAKNITPKREA